MLFTAWYNYASTGAPEWRVASAMEKQADGSYYGAVFATKGIALDAIGGRIHEFAWQAYSNLVSGIVRDVTSSVQPVGTARLVFPDGERGTLTYTSDGLLAMKGVKRMAVGTAVPLCQQ